MHPLFEDQIQPSIICINFDEPQTQIEASARSAYVDWSGSSTTKAMSLSPPKLPRDILVPLNPVIDRRSTCGQSFYDSRLLDMQGHRGFAGQASRGRRHRDRVGIKRRAGR